MTSLRFTEFCETQWRHLVKTRLYNTPFPQTSFCETQWRQSVKKRLYKNPLPYFIVLAGSMKTKEVEVIEFHRIRKSTILFYTLCRKRDEETKGIFAEFAEAKNIK